VLPTDIELDSPAEGVQVQSARRLPTERFIERQNISDQPQTKTDPVKRTMLKNLLKAEKAKLAAHEKGK
jgi:hypothetical protein